MAKTDPYARCTWRNKSFDNRTVSALQWAEKRFLRRAPLLRKHWVIAQGSYNGSVDVSGGTRDGGGAVAIAVLMTLGRLDEALGHLLEIYPASLDRPQLSFSVHFNLACVYSMKKNTEKALQNLALATQIDPASTLASLGDPQLDFIRADGRFRELSQAVENFVLQNQQ